MTVIGMSNTSFEVLNFNGVTKIEFVHIAGIPYYTIYQSEKSTRLNGNDYRIAIM